jgi:hypothetical protein
MNMDIGEILADYEVKEEFPHAEIFQLLINRWTDAGRSTRELCELVGISRQRVCDYKNGHRGVPEYLWIKLLKATGLEMIWHQEGVILRKQTIKRCDIPWNLDIKDFIL